MREQINLQDKNGMEIREGDIVRFYCGERIFGDPSTLGYDHENATEMIDVVKKMGDEYYFVCDLGLASFAWRHNKHCEVIGNVYDNPELCPCEQLLPRLIAGKYL
jgi:uncharacterized phage protein (TIGR01671 family)